MQQVQVVKLPWQLERESFSVRTAVGMTLLSVLLWGFSPIGTRYMVGIGEGGLSPVAFTGLRYGIAAVLLSPFLLLTRNWTGRDWLSGAISGVIGVTGSNLPAAIGQQTVSAGLTGLLNATQPLLIVLFASMMLRKIPTLLTISSVTIGLLGVVLLAHGTGPALGTTKGILLVLAGAVLWALYCVLVTSLIRRRGALSTTAVTVSFGALPMVLFGAPEIPDLIANMSLVQWTVMFALIAGPSVAAMFCWNAGSAVLGPQRAGWFLYLLPLVSLLGGAVLLSEPINFVELFGGALILFSVFLSHLETRSAKFN